MKQRACCRFPREEPGRSVPGSSMRYWYDSTILSNNEMSTIYPSVQGMFAAVFYHSSSRGKNTFWCRDFHGARLSSVLCRCCSAKDTSTWSKKLHMLISSSRSCPSGNRLLMLMTPSGVLEMPHSLQRT